MSTGPRISALIGAACAVLVLAGCSSSGSVGASGSSHGSGGTTGGNSATDPGCSEAMLAIRNAKQVQDSTDVQAALKVANTSIGQLQDAAQKTQKSGGKDAMNKVAGDLQTMVTQAESGQRPSADQALADAQVVAGICGGS